MGHSDILDHHHGDGEDGLCFTSFYGENNLSSLRLGLPENMFSNVMILCCVPLVSVNGLTFWGMVLLEYLVVLIVRHSVI